MAHWDNRALSALVSCCLTAQYALGVLDVVLLAPVWLQIAHLLGADILWAALVVLTARTARWQPKRAAGMQGHVRLHLIIPCSLPCFYFTSTPAAG